MAGVLLRMLRTPPADWTANWLRTHTNNQLDILCYVNGIPKHGTKNEKIARILEVRDLFAVLAAFDTGDGRADADALAKSMKHKELVALARRAKTFRSSTKYGIAVGLVKWRAHTRSQGALGREDVQRQWQEARERNPEVQGVFRFED